MEVAISCQVLLDSRKMTTAAQSQPRSCIYEQSQPRSCIYEHWPQNYVHHSSYRIPKSCSRIYMTPSGLPYTRLNFVLMPSLRSNQVLKKRGIYQVWSTNKASPPRLEIEFLDAWDDEYDGVIIDPISLPLCSNAFASALRTSLTSWKQKGKKGVWLKILSKQADLIPIAVQEGFNFHHAETGYVMLTYWIPDEPCTLPASPSHQIGIAAFVINDKREILVVKEKCPCRCARVWKLPTGYIDKSEEIFSGAIREVREETGVDTTFLEMVAFRHAQLVAFEKSDLMFVCMLKPITFEIKIDEKEIKDAKWISQEELIGQPFYLEDQMSKRVIEICMEAYESRGGGVGFIAHQLASKFDGNLSYLYYNNDLIKCDQLI